MWTCGPWRHLTIMPRSRRDWPSLSGWNVLQHDMRSLTMFVTIYFTSLIHPYVFPSSNIITQVVIAEVSKPCVYCICMSQCSIFSSGMTDPIALYLFFTICARCRYLLCCQRSQPFAFCQDWFSLFYGRRGDKIDKHGDLYGLIWQRTRTNHFKGASVYHWKVGLVLGAAPIHLSQFCGSGVLREKTCRGAPESMKALLIDDFCWLILTVTNQQGK